MNETLPNEWKERGRGKRGNRQGRSGNKPPILSNAKLNNVETTNDEGFEKALEIIAEKYNMNKDDVKSALSATEKYIKVRVTSPAGEGVLKCIVILQYSNSSEVKVSFHTTLNSYKVKYQNKSDPRFQKLVVGVCCENKDYNKTTREYESIFTFEIRSN